MSVDVQAPANRRVLVVDDDETIRDVLVMLFDSEGYEVRSAGNGRVALEMLSSWKPHAILLDLNMPEVDGWSFRARQLANERWAQIPVIVMSAGHNLRARVDALRATAIFPKPFDLDTVLATVAALTRREQPPAHQGRRPGQ